MLKTLSFKDKRTKIVDYVEAGPAELLRAVREQKLEGIVGKRKDSLYEPGRRTGAWIKHRVNRGQEFVVGGYFPGPRDFDSLIVGYYDADKLMYVARTRICPCLPQKLVETGTFRFCARDCVRVLARDFISALLRQFTKVVELCFCVLVACGYAYVKNRPVCREQPSSKFRFLQVNPRVIAFGQPLLKSPLSCGQGRRGATNTVALRLFLAFQKLINRSANQPRNRNVFSSCNLCQLSKLFRLEPDSYEFLSHT